jgi:hypothetical protein
VRLVTYPPFAEDAMTTVTNSQTGDSGLDASSTIEIDVLMRSWAARRTSFLARQAEALANRHRFIADADELVARIVRPTLDAIAERLNADGGGGRVEESPGTAQRPLRLRLWMSLEGEVPVPGRQDGNPYFQIDLDVANRRFTIWEGDMWRKQGASRATTPWRLEEVTKSSVADPVVAILKRASAHDIEA